MVVLDTEVQEIISRTADVKSFRFKIEQEVDFQAGQFFFVGLKIGAEEKTKHFSFSNSPTEKGYVEFTKRITESEFSQALKELKIGDWAKLKLPYGNFTLPQEEQRIAFLSGGIGITPIRSMCKFATDKKLPLNMVLLYGNNRPEDIIFREDFEQMSAENKNLRVVHTLTDRDIDKKAWSGHRGLIDAEMIRQEIKDYEERIFYLCGPPKMVESLKDVLSHQLNLQEDKIKTENFTGY